MADYIKNLKKMLREAGCTFERQGKGDHELWYRALMRLLRQHILSILFGNIGLHHRRARPHPQRYNYDYKPRRCTIVSSTGHCRQHCFLVFSAASPFYWRALALSH